MRLIIVFCIICASCNNDRTKDNASDSTSATNASPGFINYDIVKIYPHDTTAFTEGLLYYDGYLYESTGLEGKSVIKIIDLKKNEVIHEYNIPDKKYFGEGITIFKDEIFQLTWKDHVVYVYDAKTLKLKRKLAWPYEGWGITNNGESLIISTGSSMLYFVNPSDFKIERQVNVKNEYGFVSNLNEPEYINGYVYANVWGEDYVMKIDTESGTVKGKIDFAGILQRPGVPYIGNKSDVLNGIAYNSVSNHLFITGKYWPVIFEIAFK